MTTLSIAYNRLLMALDDLELEEEQQIEGSALPFSSRFVFALATFFSAFLLFQVQLILAKFLLPWFGGSSAVWTTCMLVYQLLLLAGYAYSHLLAVGWNLRKQASFHLGLLALTGLWLFIMLFIWGSPLLPSAGWKVLARGNPLIGLLALLLLSIGLPFFLLSTTGPLLQSWYAKLQSPEGDRRTSPFFLYALSNTGSLLGLITYPIFFERAFSLHIQSIIWICAFAFFAICCASCARRAYQNPSSATSDIIIATSTEVAPRTSISAKFAPILWWLLAACGSLVMLATTNLLTQDVAPVPLLWVMPLSVYLLTFIIVFQNDRWYRREIFQPLLVIALIAARIALFRGTDMPVWSQVWVYLFALFAVCMVCHGELSRLRPEPRRLTSFYLILAVGGATGGVFVAIIAPQIFPAFWEYQIGLWVAAALLALVLFADRESWFYHPKPWLALALLLTFASVPKYLASKELVSITPAVNHAYTACLVLFALLTLWMGISRGPEWMQRREFRWNQVSVASGLFLLTVVLMWKAGEDGKLLYRSRNFYGALRVQEQTGGPLGLKFIELLHGRIAHGLQLESTDPAERDTPTSYYNHSSGAGLALSNHTRRAVGPLRVGAVGLGVGTLAAYSTPGDVFRFYEINPEVIRLAQGKGGFFTFLKDAKGKIEIVRGDARLSLESELQQLGDKGEKYDVILLDAFNGDSIPMHLLTTQAMELYLKHLRGPESLIAIHISNLAVNLEPIIAGLADHFGMKATLISTEEKNQAMLASDWVLLTHGDALNAPEIRAAGLPMLKFRPGDIQLHAPIWTDDHSEVFSLLKKQK